MVIDQHKHKRCVLVPASDDRGRQGCMVMDERVVLYSSEVNTGSRQVPRSLVGGANDSLSTTEGRRSMNIPADWQTKNKKKKQ